MLETYYFYPEKFDGVLIRKNAHEKGYGVWDVIVKNTSFTFATIDFINECIKFGIAKENLVHSIITDLDMYVDIVNRIPCLRHYKNMPKAYVLKENIRSFDAYVMLKEAREKFQIKVEVIGY
jgi:hypothetical protein